MPEPSLGKNLRNILLLTIVVFVIIVLAQPCDFKVSRSITINAPVAAVFAQVNDPSKWEQWSPWAKLDPNGVFTYEAPHAGVGAIAHWHGNSDIGEGSSIITESVPNRHIVYTLDIHKPAQATDILDFTFKPTGKTTEVTWTIEAHNGFMGKAVGLLINCKKMLGAQFEQGLGSLKALVEKK